MFQALLINVYQHTATSIHQPAYINQYIVCQVNLPSLYMFQALLFLKLHDGFHNPIEFSLRWSVFKFNWRHSVNSEAMTRSKIAGTGNISTIVAQSFTNLTHWLFGLAWSVWLSWESLVPRLLIKRLKVVTVPLMVRSLGTTRLNLVEICHIDCRRSLCTYCIF